MHLLQKNELLQFPHQDAGTIGETSVERPSVEVHNQQQDQSGHNTGRIPDGSNEKISS